MRLFQNFPEAFAEIRRDLAEMGRKKHTRTMQDKVIEHDPGFATLSLNDYDYRVVQPAYGDLNVSRPWADAEWQERLAGINGHDVNPGEAWRLRPEVWSQFLEADGRFAYTYSNRLSRDDQVLNVIDALKKDPNSRQAVISIWSTEDTYRLGKRRVPCSITYELEFWDKALHITYRMRSCDIVTHFHNDIFFALQLRDYIAAETGLHPGTFCHLIRNLHVYQKDVAGVF